MKGLIVSLLTLCLHIQLWGQEQVTNIKYQETNYTISSTFQTEDKYWYNVYSDGSPYSIMVSDGTAQNTTIFNFEGLNILPNFIVDAVKFDGFYYLLINSDSKDFVIRTSLQNGKWQSEVLNSFIPNGKFKILNNRLFLIQKFSFSVFEVMGLDVKIAFFKNIDTYDAIIEDFEIQKDGSQLVFINDKKKVGLSIIILKNNKENEVFLSKAYLSTPYSCTNLYKIISDESSLNIYTGQQFFQINTDSLTYKEPLKGQYLSDVLVKENYIYVASSSSGETSKVYQYSKSGKKIKEIEIPFRAITKMWDIDNENVLFRSYCSYPIIISYNFINGSYFADHTIVDNGFLFINGKLYFTGEKSGNIYLENGKLPQNNAQTIGFNSIYSNAKTTFSLKLINDSLYVKSDILSENSKLNIISIQSLIQKANIINSSTASSRRLITTDGQYQVDYTYPNNIEFFDGKNIRTIKTESGENIRYNSSSNIFAFKKEYFLINHRGLFCLKDNSAFELAKSWNENRSEYDAAFYLASLKDKFIFALYNSQYEREVWISDGTKNGTKQINNTNLLNARIIGLFQGKLHYLVNAKLFSFDGITEKLVGSIGNNYYEIYEKSDTENVFYFFNTGNDGIEVSKLNNSGLLEKIFTLDVFKGVKDMGVAKLISPNIFQIFHYGIKTAYLLQIDMKDDKYKLIKLDSTFSIDNYAYNFEKNQGPYFNAKQILVNWLPNDLREIYSNNIVRIDNNVQFKPIFQFNSKAPNYETVTISNLRNKALIFLGSRKNIWQIDTTTDIATQFIYEKDNLRFYKIIDGKLYLNLCKDGQCHLYRTDGSNKNTYQLTQTPLVVQDMFVLNNELYLYASNTEVGFQIWKIRKDDERKVEKLFTEKVESTPNLNFVVLDNEEEKDEQITVFPNPFTEKIDLLINKSSFKGIEIFGMNGVKLFESNQNFESSLEELNKFLEQSRNSIFYLKVKTNYRVTVKKIFKQ